MLDSAILAMIIFSSIVVAALSFVLTSNLIPFFKRIKVLDYPDEERKKQRKPVPLMGSTAFIICIISAISLIIFASYFKLFDFNNYIDIVNWADKLIFIIIASLIILIEGYLDDTKRIGSLIQFGLIALAVLIAIFGAGLEIFYFDSELQILLPNFLDSYSSNIVTFLWLIFCIGATKFLDGHDGLVGSIGVIAFLSIGFVSLFGAGAEPLIALISLVAAFSIIGFLPFNLPNAKTYLGEGGSIFIGFLIGVLSILSNTKVITSVSILGFFVIDLIIIWIIRILDNRNPLTSGDRTHWHHRLETVGLNKSQVLQLTAFVVTVSSILVIILGRFSAWLIVLFQLSIMIASLVFFFRQKRIDKATQNKIN